MQPTYYAGNYNMHPFAYGMAQVAHVLLRTRHGRWLGNRYNGGTCTPKANATVAACPVAKAAVVNPYLATVQAQLNGAHSVA